MNKSNNVQKYFIDVYKCANINYRDIPKSISTPDFKELLHSTQISCQNDNVKSIFLAISQQDSHLVETAVSDGYTFHYVQDNALFLYKKLFPNHIPNYASHHIGTGGAVLSKDLKLILAVKGKNSDN